MTTTERDVTEQDWPADWPEEPRALPDGEWQETLWELTDEGVLAITLNRPERLNALSFRLLHELQALIDFAARRPDVRVVTLRGAGEQAFCSGDDLYGMEPVHPTDNSITVHHPFLLSLRSLRKPVVALVRGWALGHGWELASACDMRLCADNIEVGDHRVQRAIGMNGGTTWFAPRIVGRGRALELLVTGRHLDAEEALAWGWANRVWPLEDFEEEAARFVSELASLPTLNASAYKEMIDYAAEHSLRDTLSHEVEVSDRYRRTYDANEGRLSWREKRAPIFRGY